MHRDGSGEGTMCYRLETLLGDRGVSLKLGAIKLNSATRVLSEDELRSFVSEQTCDHHACRAASAAAISCT
jgi:hypothetical protein